MNIKFCLFVLLVVNMHASVYARSNAANFNDDLQFIKKHDTPIVLKATDSNARIIVSAKYQGRVLTSKASGNSNLSNGWLNYQAIEKGNPGVGGEDRFWLSPIGSQFSVFYPSGSTIEEKNWRVPSTLATHPVKVVERDAPSITFHKTYNVENNVGTKFVASLDRKIRIYSKNEIKKSLNTDISNAVDMVGFESFNTLKNQGDDWKASTGLIGIWSLGMFQGDDNATAIFPMAKSIKNTANTPTYLYPLTSDRYVQKGNTLYYKVDGKYRSKIGIKAAATKPIMGYFNAATNVLTIVTFTFEHGKLYPDAAEGVLKKPYMGDVINSYNHGAMDGSVLKSSSFFELESASQLKPLKHGEFIEHTHRTFHFTGDVKELNRLSVQLLGVTIDEITSVFR